MSDVVVATIVFVPVADLRFPLKKTLLIGTFGPQIPNYHPTLSHIDILVQNICRHIEAHKT